MDGHTRKCRENWVIASDSTEEQSFYRPSLNVLTSFSRSANASIDSSLTIGWLLRRNFGVMNLMEAAPVLAFLLTVRGIQT